VVMIIVSVHVVVVSKYGAHGNSFAELTES